MVERGEQRVVVARKEHRCRECGCLIEIGEKHIDDVLKDDDVYHWRAHTDCFALAMEYDQRHGDILLPEGRPPLIEIDHFRETMDEWVGKFPAVIARMKKRMAKWK